MIKVRDIIDLSRCKLVKIWFFRKEEQEALDLKFNKIYSKKYQVESKHIDLAKQDYDYTDIWGDTRLMLLNNRVLATWDYHHTATPIWARDVYQTRLVEMLDSATNIGIAHFYETKEDMTRRDGGVDKIRCINIFIKEK